jgi:hypothetical protein
MPGSYNVLRSCGGEETRERPPCIFYHTLRERIFPGLQTPDISKASVLTMLALSCVLRPIDKEMQIVLIATAIDHTFGKPTKLYDQEILCMYACMNAYSRCRLNHSTNRGCICLALNVFRFGVASLYMYQCSICSEPSSLRERPLIFDPLTTHVIGVCTTIIHFLFHRQMTNLSMVCSSNSGAKGIRLSFMILHSYG